MTTYKLLHKLFEITEGCTHLPVLLYCILSSFIRHMICQKASTYNFYRGIRLACTMLGVSNHGCMISSIEVTVTFNDLQKEACNVMQNGMVWFDTVEVVGNLSGRLQLPSRWASLLFLLPSELLPCNSLPNWSVLLLSAYVVQPMDISRISPCNFCIWLHNDQLLPSSSLWV